jgi:altered-inheritance-of-mitochondria protein 13
VFEDEVSYPPLDNEDRKGDGIWQLMGNSGARPLDCWKEVEEFKRQARRMEKEFVVRIVGREY